MTTKVASISVTAPSGAGLTVTAPGVVAIDDAAATFAITSAPEWSETPDSVTATLGRITLLDPANFENGYVPSDPDDEVTWSDFLPLNHDIAGGAFDLPNEDTFWVVRWTAIKGARPPAYAYSDVLPWRAFALVDGQIGVTGFTNQITADDVLTVDDGALVFSQTTTARSLRVSLVAANGDKVEIPLDGTPPTPATVSYVGQASAGASSLTYPAHNDGDVAFMLAFGGSLNPAIAIAAGWTEIPEARYAIRPETNNLITAVFWKPLLAAETTSETFTNAVKLLCTVYRGLDPLSPFSTPVAVARNDPAAASIAYPAVGAFDPTQWVVEFRHRENSTTTFPPAQTGFTDRVTRDTATWNGIAISDTNGAVASASAESAALSPTSRAQVVRLALRPGVAP